MASFRISTWWNVLGCPVTFYDEIPSIKTITSFSANHIIPFCGFIRLLEDVKTFRRDHVLLQCFNPMFCSISSMFWCNNENIHMQCIMIFKIETHKKISTTITTCYVCCQEWDLSHILSISLFNIHKFNKNTSLMLKFKKLY